MRTVVNRDGQHVVMSRKARLIIMYKDGRELQSHDLEYGSILHVTNNQEVAVGDKLVEWDPTNKVILTEVSGTTQFNDLVENVTVQERFEEGRNKSTLMILEHKSEKYQPAISIVNDEGEEIAYYYLPAGSSLKRDCKSKDFSG